MLRPAFTIKQFRKALDDRIEAIHAATLRRLVFLGEKCLIECRSNKTYMDQTGNLTSSMGYVVISKGMILTSGGFEGSAEGASVGTQVSKVENPAKLTTLCRFWLTSVGRFKLTTPCRSKLTTLYRGKMTTSEVEIEIML